jgi:hypothetical protein
VAGSVALLALAQTWRLARRTAMPSRRARARGRKAARAERDAEPMLAALGYRVLMRQPTAELTVRVDGSPVVISVRGDLLVQRGARRLLAEVKDGELAPRITHGPTRRQLLEYRVAFEVDGILLVDPARESVVEVELPLGQAERTRAAVHRDRAVWLAAGAALGVALVVLLTSWR